MWGCGGSNNKFSSHGVANISILLPSLNAYMVSEHQTRGELQLFHKPYSKKKLTRFYLIGCHTLIPPNCYIYTMLIWYHRKVLKAIVFQFLDEVDNFNILIQKKSQLAFDLDINNRIQVLNASCLQKNTI